MRPRHETMDEAIDRVAASLTAVRDDADFVARIEARLDVRSPRARGLWLVAASATVAVILAIVFDFDRTTTNPIEVNPPRVAETPAAESIPLPAPAVIEAAGSGEQQLVRVQPPPAHATLESVPQIAALTGPQTLNVDDLLFEPLSIEPVIEPGALELPGLEVRDLEVADQKEQ